MPEKTSIRKTSKHWVDIELKNAASEKHRFRNFFKAGTTESRSKFESQSKLVRKMLSQKKKHFIKTNYDWNPTTTAENFPSI